MHILNTTFVTKQQKPGSGCGMLWCSNLGKALRSLHRVTASQSHHTRLFTADHAGSHGGDSSLRDPRPRRSVRRLRPSTLHHQRPVHGPQLSLQVRPLYYLIYY